MRLEALITFVSTTQRNECGPELELHIIAFEHSASTVETPIAPATQRACARLVGAHAAEGSASMAGRENDETSWDCQGYPIYAIYIQYHTV